MWDERRRQQIRGGLGHHSSSHYSRRHEDGSESSSAQDPLHISASGVDSRKPQASATSMSRKFFLTPPERLQVDQSVNLMDCELGQYYDESRRRSLVDVWRSSQRHLDGSQHPPPPQVTSFLSSMWQSPTSLWTSSAPTTTRETFVDEELGANRDNNSRKGRRRSKKAKKKAKKKKKQVALQASDSFDPNHWEDRALKVSRSQPLLVATSDEDDSDTGRPQQRTRAKKNRRRRRQLRPGRVVLLCLGLFVVLMIVLIPLVAVGEIGWFRWHHHTTKEEDSPAFVPARNHSYLDLAALPDSTQALLYHHDDDISSPQKAALDWIGHDPLVGILAGPAAERLHVAPQDHDNNAAMETLAAEQRFVLATLFFATHGDTWVHAKYFYETHKDDDVNVNVFQQQENAMMDINHQWLDIGLNECDWFGIHPLFEGNYSVCNRYHQLHALKLRNHNLTGQLPLVELGMLSNLKHLDVGHNALTGNLLSSDDAKDEVVWNQWKNLETFDVAHNSMTGSLPSELGYLTNSNGLNTLVFKYNSFEGSLPSELGLLVPRLLKLDLVSNHLTGTIPTELGGILGLQDVAAAADGYRALEHLSLSHNRFTGMIPSELGLLSQLTNLMLNDNPGLTPQQAMPSEICDLQRNGRLHKLTIDCHIVNCGEGCDCTCITPLQVPGHDPMLLASKRSSQRTSAGSDKRGH